MVFQGLFEDPKVLTQRVNITYIHTELLNAPSQFMSFHNNTSNQPVYGMLQDNHFT